MTAAKRETSTVTPRLRFPEFRDGPRWEERTLAEVCERITQGGTPDTSNPEYWNGDIDWLTPAEMGKTESPLIDSTARKITELGLQNCSSELLPMRSVIISTRAPIGHLAINTVPMAINQGCKGLIPAGGLNYAFLFSSLLGSKSRLIDLGAGNTFKELSGSVLKSFTIPVAPLIEQQKIADCLMSLDEVISGQGRKVEALEAHKRGLMQQLFPREGETVPRLRFPEFRDGPEWAIRELGPMASKVGSGITPLGGGRNYKTRGILFIRSQNVRSGYLMLDDVAYIDEETHRTFNATEIRDRDVLLNITGASIGRSAVADSRIVGGNVNQHVCIIRVNPNQLNPVLLNQYLISDRGQKQIDSFQAGGNREGLNFRQIRSFEIPLPPTEHEQQRIADCLLLLDAQIAAESEMLASLKTHKQGLMQQLFPSLVED